MYDREAINAILDAALICHLGFVRDGLPVVIPTIHARVGDTLYVHGSKASGNLRKLADGVDVCVAMTVVDGIVAARSLFEHSMNYRSAVVFGRSRLVEAAEERHLALRAITEHVLPGRWDDARRPSRAEDRQTSIVAIGIDEASAKVRDGFPEDADEDLALGVWAGVVPLRLAFGEPIADPGLDRGIPLPEYIRDLVEGD